MTMQPLKLPLADVLHTVNVCTQQIRDDSLDHADRMSAYQDATNTLRALADALADLARTADDRATETQQDPDRHTAYAALADDLRNAASWTHTHRAGIPHPDALDN